MGADEQHDPTNHKAGQEQNVDKSSGNAQTDGAEDELQVLSSADIRDVSRRILSPHDLLAQRVALLDTQQETEEEHEALAERRALRRGAGLSTELEDVSEVEYRRLRLERVVLVGLRGEDQDAEAENSLRELAALAETAGSTVVDAVLQRKRFPDPSTFLGSGKAEEVALLVASTEADTVIVDGDLAPSQRRALEDLVKVKVVDRTALILDIFAQHAKSREGKSQVELAQLEYLLPRLRGWGESMSRQAGGRVGASGGGIGSRGPGEMKIELDRRHIRRRMAKLRRELAAMKSSRTIQRASRRASHTPAVALVGYTNAGKSSLINRLTHADLLVGNALFATLDPTVRRARTPENREYTLTDTVGFVRSLPTQLVEAFRSTLEEIAESQLMLHVVDVAHPDPEQQIRAVRAVLDEMELRDIPEMLVFNKADTAEPFVVDTMQEHHPDAVFVSARTGEGLEELERRIAWAIPHPRVEVSVLLPYDRGDLVSRLYSLDADILGREDREEGTWLRAKIHEDFLVELQPFVVA